MPCSAQNCDEMWEIPPSKLVMNFHFEKGILNSEAKVQSLTWGKKTG